MSCLRAASAALLLLPVSIAIAGEPARWRPVIDREGRPLTAAATRGANAPAAEAGQRAFIDSATGELVDAPADEDPSREGAEVRAPDSAFVVRRTPEGFLALDVRALHVSSTARIGADGRIVTQCGEHPGAAPDHVHEAAAAAQEPSR